ncbi:MAG: hypothetical protein ACOZAQ_10490 [Pseudomonadota bacterium]
MQTVNSHEAKSLKSSSLAIAIKCSLGREDFNFRSGDIQRLAVETGFAELPVLPNHSRAPRKTVTSEESEAGWG